jgi:hypothetical protein
MGTSRTYDSLAAGPDTPDVIRDLNERQVAFALTLVDRGVCPGDPAAVVDEGESLP